MTDSIEARLQRLEDQQAITKLIASYGPAVDAGNADATSNLWSADGDYVVENWRMVGRAGVHDMVSSAAHQDMVNDGCCHLLGPVVVTVTGDTAVAVCESLVVVREAEGYRVWRASVNHFALQRLHGIWQITLRTSHLIDGDPATRALLNAGLAGEAAGVIDQEQRPNGE